MLLQNGDLRWDQIRKKSPTSNKSKNLWTPKLMVLGSHITPKNFTASCGFPIVIPKPGRILGNPKVTSAPDRRGNEESTHLLCLPKNNAGECSRTSKETTKKWKKSWLNTKRNGIIICLYCILDVLFLRLFVVVLTAHIFWVVFVPYMQQYLWGDVYALDI